MISPLEIIITFGTTRDAIKSGQVLLEAGLPVKTMALPSALGAGCGLCLRLKVNEFDSGRVILVAAGIEPEGFYYKEMNEGRSVYRPVFDVSL